MTTSFDLNDSNLWANYYEDLGPDFIAGSIISIIFLFLAFPLRIFAQSLPSRADEKGAGFNWSKAIWRSDTYYLTAASIIAIGCAIVTIIPVSYGLGKHQLRVLHEDPESPRNVAVTLMYGYILKILQAPCLMFTKLAIVSLYYKLFGASKKISYTLHFIAVGTVLLGIGSTTIFILACVPARIQWEQVYFIFPGKIPEGASQQGYCMPATISLIVPLYCDLFFELLLLVIPAIALWKVHLTLRKKICLYMVFTLGGFITAISAIRIHYAWQIEDMVALDLTWINAPAYIWTTVQCCFGVVCASLPGMAPLNRLFRKSDKEYEASEGELDSYKRP